jgi:hypothetical protein
MNHYSEISSQDTGGNVLHSVTGRIKCYPGGRNSLGNLFPARFFISFIDPGTATIPDSVLLVIQPEFHRK